MFICEIIYILIYGIMYKKNFTMEKISLIFNETKESTSRHQKLLQKLENIRLNSDEEQFFQNFFKCIRIIFHMDLKTSKAEVNRLMSFAVKFCVNKKLPENSDQKDEFLKRVLLEALRFHNVDFMTERFRCCQFVTMLLKEIGDECIDNEVWDAIQDAMLERLQDPKSIIRLQAVGALRRLQEPTNNECPVIRAFVNCLYDSCAAIRKAVVESIGPNALTIPRIVERLRDVDDQVRAAAFRKCGPISPEYMKIAIRQQVLRCGFSERNLNARRAFTDYMLPKWLDVFNNDIILFFKKLNLDADEEDLEQTFNVYKNLMEVLCKNSTFDEITNNLPLNGGKCVPIEQLSFEVISYWNLLTGYLRKIEDADEYLERVMPDLVDMCTYIERLTENSSKKKMEDYEVLVYEYTLYLLFDMVEQYDFGDELSRKTVHKLITDSLLKYTFHSKLLSKMMGILVQLHNKNTYELSNEICHLVSEIREPLVSVEPTDDVKRNYEFEVAQIEFRIIKLDVEREQAVKIPDYMKAFHLKQQMDELKEELKKLKEKPPNTTQRKTQDDTETTVRCLDILIALLQQPSVKSMTPFLQTCKDMYLLPLISTTNTEIFWRAIKLLVLYCLIDKEVMTENCKLIFGAMAFYKMTQTYERNTLFVTLEAVSDLIMIYGREILQCDEMNTTQSDETINSTRRRLGDRRLYNDDDHNTDFGVDSIREITFKDIVHILADLMDDECSEVGFKAGTTLVHLLLNGYCSSASLVSRLILKWHTLEYGIQLQQLLGHALLTYAKEVEGSEDVIEKAVIPTLVSIAKAPKNSPLVNVDSDSVIRFLQSITIVKIKQNVVVSAHDNIAQTILHRINRCPDDVTVNLLVKMLTHLQLTTSNVASCRELIQQTEMALENIRDKVCQKHLQKFLSNLKQASANKIIMEETEDMETETIINQTESLRLETSDENRNLNTEKVLNNVQEKTPPPSVKRRRRKSNKSMETRLSDMSDETVLHTIIDTPFEQQILEDLTIQSVTSSSNSDKSLRRSSRHRTVVVETSTDSESSQKKTLKRTKKKKRRL